MQVIRFIAVLTVAAAAVVQGAAQSRPLYLDPDAGTAARARDLVSRMTTDEKVG